MLVNSLLIGFSLLHSVWVGYRVHPASYALNTKGLYPCGMKRQQQEADCLPPHNAKIKNDGALPSLPFMAFMTKCLVTLPFACHAMTI
jgi:hypothetical protein